MTVNRQVGSPSALAPGQRPVGGHLYGTTLGGGALWTFGGPASGVASGSNVCGVVWRPWLAKGNKNI